MNKVIEVKNFSKSFGSKKVVNDLSFDVYEGEIFAFLGLNGSGKTTTIRTLLRIYQRDAGSLKILGQEYSPNFGKIIGYLPEERGLYMNTKVFDTMLYLAELKGMQKSLATKKIYEYLDRVELRNLANVKISKLSSGQQQKIQIGITIINDPKILILDEPTKGFDPINKQILLDYLLELNKKGSTIIFITHQMDEVETIADRLLILKNGKAALYGKVSEIKASFGNNIVKLEFDGEFKPNDKLFEASVNKHFAEIRPLKKVSTDEILKYLISLDLSIKSFEIGSLSIQQIFLKVYND